MNRNVRLGSLEADSETSIWMQVIYHEAILGKSGKGERPQVREWKEAAELCDLKQNALDVDSACCLKGESRTFCWISEQGNMTLHTLAPVSHLFVKSWLKGREGNRTVWLWVPAGKHQPWVLLWKTVTVAQC